MALLLGGFAGVPLASATSGSSASGSSAAGPLASDPLSAGDLAGWAARVAALAPDTPSRASGEGSDAVTAGALAAGALAATRRGGQDRQLISDPDYLLVDVYADSAYDCPGLFCELVASSLSVPKSSPSKAFFLGLTDVGTLGSTPLDGGAAVFVDTDGDTEPDFGSVTPEAYFGLDDLYYSPLFRIRGDDPVATDRRVLWGRTDRSWAAIADTDAFGTARIRYSFGLMDGDDSDWVPIPWSNWNTLPGAGSPTPVPTPSATPTPAPTVTVTASPTVPPGPIPVIVSARPGDGSVALGWTPALPPSGAPVVSYLVQMSRDGGATWVDVSTVPASTTSVIITGLANGSPVVFRVAAVEAAGPGEFSAPSAAVTPAAAIRAPGRVTHLSAVSSQRGRATVTWRAPSSGSPATGFLLRVRRGTGTFGAVRRLPAGTTSMRFASLPSKVRFTVRVTAFNQAGSGPLSEVSFRVR